MEKDIDDKGAKTIDNERGLALYKIITSSEKYKNRYIKHSIRLIKSKKNTVTYLILNDKPRVLKWFAPGFKKNMETEYTVLKNGSSQIYIPTPLEKDEENNIIVMNYITGENYCDIINDEKTSNSEKQRLIVLLAEWYARFHNHFKTTDGFRIRGDSILRNFIFSDHIWGVDLEESRNGRPIEDIAGMCASILSTDPMFTDEKFKLCKTFIASYKDLVKWHLENVNDEIAYALLEKIQWRPEKEDILREYSHRIRRRGL